MSDRVVENASEEIPEIPEIVEQVLLMALDEAKNTMVAGDDVVPFTCLAVKENVFIETHPGDDADECFAKAKKEVSNARGAAAYAFCYDGFVDTDDGVLDVIIAEGGLPGSPDGFAIGLIYAMVSFLAVVLLTKVYMGAYRERKAREQELEQKEEKKREEAEL